ncbi:MAG: PEP-CTERM sorting domain-containing protein [Planctomycetota bacterium]
MKNPQLNFAVSTLVGLVLLASSLPAATYEFDFDNVDDGVVSAPFVGTGFISFDQDLPDGTHAYSKLTNVSIGLAFGDDVFKEIDIVTPLDEILVVISNHGNNLNFSNSNEFGTGDFNGAVDFVNLDNQSSLALSTEPPGTGGNLDRYGTIDEYGYPQFFGNYGATLVPEPASEILLLMSLGIGFLFVRRR